MPIEQSEGEPMERPHGLMALPSTPLNRPEIDINYSLNGTELTRRVLALADQGDRIANFAQGLPQMGDYDALNAKYEALLCEHAAMREKLAGLETMVQRMSVRTAA